MRTHGYYLFQIDWPDGVFIHRDYVDTFPKVSWLHPEEFSVAVSNGYLYAERFSRYQRHMSELTFVKSLHKLARRSALEPNITLDIIESKYQETWRKRPLWIQIGISGTGYLRNYRSNSSATNLYRGYVPYRKFNSVNDVFFLYKSLYLEV